MLRLRYHSTTTIPVEAECITPDQLADKSVAGIARLPVQHGNCSVPLGEFFAAEGDASDRELVIEGDCSRVKWIGAGMKTGQITIQGAAGMHLGAEMAGGSIQVYGQVGDWAGAEMRGGRIRIHGNAGHLVGGAYRGSRIGMRGGVILVDGNAGNEIGGSMRRGLIAIGGQAGDFAGVALVAGTVILFGEPGIRMGAGMKRGSILTFASQPALLPTFRLACVYRPVFPRLYLQQLKAWGFAVPETIREGSYRRYCGDLVGVGKGEILHWQPD